MLDRIGYTFWLLLATVCLALLNLQAQAQQLPLELNWRTGTVILNSGDTIKGGVILTLPTDLIRVSQPDGTISAFSPVNVISFEVQDNENHRGLFSRSGAQAAFNVRRQYITLPWNHDKDYSNFKTPAFFVLIYSGKYSLLMRESQERVNDPASAVYSAANSGLRTTRDIIRQQYYLLSPEQNIVRLSNPKKDILRIFNKQQKQISAYVKENKLSFTEAQELARILKYVNSILP